METFICSICGEEKELISKEICQQCGREVCYYTCSKTTSIFDPTGQVTISVLCNDCKDNKPKENPTTEVIKLTIELQEEKEKCRLLEAKYEALLNLYQASEEKYTRFVAEQTKIVEEIQRIRG